MLCLNSFTKPALTEAGKINCAARPSHKSNTDNNLSPVNEKERLRSAVISVIAEFNDIKSSEKTTWSHLIKGEDVPNFYFRLVEYLIF